MEVPPRARSEPGGIGRCWEVAAMELSLTVGFDGSEPGFRALDWAVDEAAVHGLTLRVVHASRWERYELSAGPLQRRAGEQAGRDAVGAAVRRAEERNPRAVVETEVLAEDPAQALVRASRTSWALVTGARGLGGFPGLLLGSVGLEVAARALCPVIVVRGDASGSGAGARRILLGVSDSPGSAEAVRFALREAAARGCPLEGVRAWRCPAHETTPHPALADGVCLYHQARADTLLDEALTAPLRHCPSVHPIRTLVEGPAHRVLVDRTSGADLVVIGAHRRPHRPGPQLGRVAQALLHHSRCPVAVVPRVEDGARG
ncbi:universal stress protein [Streptomyces racemochromogenes]|uniref:Universal stress protein n=1 Tax=Streptomyces racemochromogenes TaxID=67353 RepID=A0ABW7P8N0_9ACTN